MSAVLWARVLIAVAAGGARLVTWAERASTGQPGANSIPKWLFDRLQDEDASDEELSTAVSEWSGTVSAVATYADPFELRRFHVIFDRASGNVEGDDIAMFTFDCLKLSGGAPSSDWLAADYTAVDGAVAALWASLKVNYNASISLSRLKGYKAGPAINPPQVAVYDNDMVNVAGTAGAMMLPPQTALSVTERAGSKLHWGRLYLPSFSYRNASNTELLTANGRPTSAFCSAVADAFDTMYEALRTANLPVVVYRPPLPERETKGGATLPARTASAWTVDTLAVDDVADVIRSRRWKNPTVRVLRGVGS